MTKPVLSSFEEIASLTIHQYERYLPTAFDESLSLIEKMNKIIAYMNEIGAVSNDIVSQWNGVMEWVMNEGLEDEVTNRFNGLLNNGTINDIINNTLFRGYDQRLTVAENKINNVVSGTPKGSYQLLSELQSAFPNGTTGIYVVRADGEWYYWNGSAWASGGTYLAAPIGDYSIKSKNLSKQRAELIDYGGSILVDNNNTLPAVILNADGTNSNIYAMSNGTARILTLSVAGAPTYVYGDPAVESYVVQYFVVDNTGTMLAKRYNLVADDDFIVGLLYNKKITLYYNQHNGFYETGEVLVKNTVRFHKQAKKIFIPKGLQVTKNQDAYYSSATNFFDVSETELSRYYVIDKTTNVVSSLIWRDVAIMSKKYVVFGFSFRGQVYIYGQGFIQDAFYQKRSWTNNPVRMIEETIKNPFVRSNVKLLGDSITAGAGGTGYSPTGDLMFTDTGGTVRYENVITATCWANMMRTMLADYSGLTYIEPLHKGFYWSSPPHFVTASTNSKSYFSYNMTDIGDYVAFSFYGDTLNINFSQGSASGIANIYIDGVLNSTFDCYASAPAFNIWKNISLSKTYHTCIIEVATNRNASSSGNSVYFNGIEIKKEIGFKNWAVSGQTSLWVYQNLANLVLPTDDLFIMQIGTNDRQQSNDWVISSMSQRVIVETILKQGSDLIVMTANSGELSNELNPARKFKSNRVADENMKVANEYNLPYVSNYNAFLNYVLMPNANYMDIMDADGTHPNDKGHKLMFRNICEKIGLNPFIGNGI